jgi:hypothetical protein
MCIGISIAETHVVSISFHPQIIPSERMHQQRLRHRKVNNILVRDRLGRELPDMSIEYAHTHPTNRLMHSSMSTLRDWISHNKMHVINENCGVVDVTNTRILAVDLILIEKATSMQSTCLILCTVVRNPHVSESNLRRIQKHAQKLHSIVNGSYHLRCRSVLLVCDTNLRFSETWT